MLNFEKIYQDYKGNIHCGNCDSFCCQRAGDIVLFPGESKFLIERVKKITNYIHEKNVNGQKIELIKQPCPFLFRGLCSIEKNRPFDCRLFPLDYCLYKNKLRVITSKSCPNLKNISKNQIERNSRLILNVLNKLPKKWIKSAVLFGPCGNCDKVNCKLRQEGGYNDQDW